MTQLRFRERDRPRPTLGSIAPVLVIGLIQTVFLVLRHGLAWAWVTLALLALVLTVGLLVRLVAETRVDSEGVTVDWGVGRRSRTYPWSRITWVDIRTTRTQYGSSRTAYIALQNGRRRLLPGLSSGALVPDPDLDCKVEQLKAVWRVHQDPAAIASPPPRRRRSWRGVIPGVLAAIALALTAWATVFAFGQVGDVRDAEALKGCGLSYTQPVDPTTLNLSPTDPRLYPLPCLSQTEARVTAVSAQWSPFGRSVLTLRDPATGLLSTATLGEPNALVDQVRVGDSAVVTFDIGGTVVDSVRYRGHTYATTDSAEVEIPQTVTAVIALGSATVLLATWAIAARRRRPGAGYPWGAALALPAVGWAFAITVQAATWPSPLTWSEYAPGLTLLALGLAAAAWLRRRRAERASAQPVMATVA